MASKAMRRLTEIERERARDNEGHRAGWVFLYTLFGFKIGTLLIIWYAASSTHFSEISFIIATTWYWLLIPAVGIAGPLIYRWRLMQMRRRRKALQHEEWMREHPKGRRETTGLTIEDVLAQHGPSRR